MTLLKIASPVKLLHWMTKTSAPKPFRDDILGDLYELSAKHRATHHRYSTLFLCWGYLRSLPYLWLMRFELIGWRKCLVNFVALAVALVVATLWEAHVASLFAWPMTASVLDAVGSFGRETYLGFYVLLNFLGAVCAIVSALWAKALVMKDDRTRSVQLILLTVVAIAPTLSQIAQPMPSDAQISRWIFACLTFLSVIGFNKLRRSNAPV